MPATRRSVHAGPSIPHTLRKISGCVATFEGGVSRSCCPAHADDLLYRGTGEE